MNYTKEGKELCLQSQSAMPMAEIRLQNCIFRKRCDVNNVNDQSQSVAQPVVLTVGIKFT